MCPLPTDSDKGTLYYQVICRRLLRMIPSGCTVFLHEWDAMYEKVNPVAAAADTERKTYLNTLRKTIAADMLRLRTIVKRFERSAPGAYTVDDIVDEFRATPCLCGFISFGRNLVEVLGHNGKRQKAERYTYTLNSFSRFLCGADLPVEDLDGNMLLAYEKYLRDNNLCINSTSFYMRNLRAIYNEAVAEGMATADGCPFKLVYTGIDKTVKRAISLDTLRLIKQLDLSSQPQLDFVRDLFMFSVYTRGMSFVDMAYLRKKDLHVDILVYHRRKTGRLLTVKWEKQMQLIVDKYDTGSSPYLLPIIRTSHDERRQYKSSLRLMNKHLKEIGRMAGLVKPLTTYVARHAWASIARNQHVPISVISEAMGHNSENTTRIYLASLDTSEIDKANREIMEALEA